ncbi:ribosome biogenesis GTP-binding protein YihA/YsxC [Fluviispira sanaruensis]|uniref:Probable GTP-binding protein EngB n=1 Tax=Fluviispira sanaruensis TaxID=2493639 RepID=A0A4P2VLP8_FLUSA|nr:ribosome biogenesis GTP-binding protein YihA/YsxC [Fluviispira sanaruensis]BBH52904.1 YihA family ribosome biogenesis GTP-binding protein [Fluviispira sanaruensis]
MREIKLPTQNFIQYLSEKKTPLHVEFVSSGMINSDLPPSTVPEFALVGRSNVGKSSLLNYLAGQKQLARVSNTPGRTQTINLFSAEKGEFLLVDLPGYGYAESSLSTRAHWQKAMQEYFEKREGLFAVFILVDIRRDIQPEDEALSRWFQQLGLKVIALQTKCDKLHKSKWNAIRIQHAKKLALSPSQVLTVSSDKKIGLPDILRSLAGMLDSLDKETEDLENAP